MLPLAAGIYRIPCTQLIVKSGKGSFMCNVPQKGHSTHLVFDVTMDMLDHSWSEMHETCLILIYNHMA